VGGLYTIWLFFSLFHPEVIDSGYNPSLGKTFYDGMNADFITLRHKYLMMWVI
jgi:hypothetical protein